MDARYINPFINGLLTVSGQLGLGSLKRTGLFTRKRLQTDNDVNIIIGLAGELKGNLVFAMQEDTACSIASVMMGGMEVPQLDMIPKSALCELANMITGNSVSKLEEMGLLVSITPPTLVNGRHMVAMISQVETLVIQFTGDEGLLEINMALEV